MILNWLEMKQMLLSYQWVIFFCGANSQSDLDHHSWSMTTSLYHYYTLYFLEQMLQVVIFALNLPFYYTSELVTTDLCTVNANWNLIFVLKCLKYSEFPFYDFILSIL